AADSSGVLMRAHHGRIHTHDPGDTTIGPRFSVPPFPYQPPHPTHALTIHTDTTQPEPLRPVEVVAQLSPDPQPASESDPAGPVVEVEVLGRGGVIWPAPPSHGTVNRLTRAMASVTATTMYGSRRCRRSWPVAD